MQVFDRGAVRAHRDRAARTEGGHEALFREVAARLAGRLDEIKRRFPLALDLGCRDGALGRALAGRGGIEMVVQCDLAPGFAARAAAGAGPALAGDASKFVTGQTIMVDGGSEFL